MHSGECQRAGAVFFLEVLQTLQGRSMVPKYCGMLNIWRTYGGGLNA